jgi:hypothetical protein
MIVIFNVRTFALPRKPKLDLVMLSAEKRLRLKFTSAGKAFCFAEQGCFQFCF